MFDDLDKTVSELLSREVPSVGSNSTKVTFDPPEGVEPPAISVFLYDIRENRELRNNEWMTERRQGIVSKSPAPLRIECSYLITAWTKSESVGTAISDEHKLLGQVTRALLRYPTIPAEFLQGELRRTQEIALPTASLQAGRLQSIGELWQAMGGKPKAALHYSVTIAVSPQEEPVEIGPPVLDKQIPGRMEAI